MSADWPLQVFSAMPDQPSSMARSKLSRSVRLSSTMTGLSCRELAHVVAVGGQVALGGLLDVQDLVVAVLRALADALQVLDDVLGALALLVGVGGEVHLGLPALRQLAPPMS